MRNLVASRSQTQGSTLVMTVVFTTLIGLALVAYLSLITYQNGINARSQAWNSAIPVVEAGLEHALAHMNANLGLDLARDGWGANGHTYVYKGRVGDDRYWYHITITNYLPGVDISAPEVVSIAYVSAPCVAAAPVPGPFLAVAASVNTAGEPSPIIRGVRIRCRLERLFSRALLAETIDLKGNNVTTDSYDSMDPSYSTNGLFDPTRPRKAGGNVGAYAGMLNVQNANIYGRLSTGPSGTVAVGPNGRVGDTNWVPSGTNSIQPGWYRNDLNVQLDPVKIPFSGGAYTPTGGYITNTTLNTVTVVTNLVTSIPYPTGVPGPIATNAPITASKYPDGSPGPVFTNYSKHGRITGYTFPTFSYSAVTETTNPVTTYYDYILDIEDGNYQLGSLRGSVYVKAKVNLYVTDSLDLTALVIQPGKALNLYSGAPTVSLGGSEVSNGDCTPDRFFFWGLPSCTSIQLSGNSSFVGCLYAPNADLNLRSGGRSVAMDFCGAAVVKTASLNGHFSFHYDEALNRTGPLKGYAVASWNEMSPTEIRQHVTSLSANSGTQSPLQAAP